MKKNLFFIAIHFCLTIPAASQTYSAHEIWTRLTVRKALSKKWELVADANYRRQNDYLQNGGSPFRFQQAHLLRVTAHYTTTKQFAFQFSPFAYVETYRLSFADAQRSEVLAVKRSEFRLTGGMSKQFTIRRLELRPRLLYEWRAFDGGDRQSRGRFEIRGQYLLRKGKEKRQLRLLAFNEIFYQITQPGSPVYDQNRSFLGVLYQTGKLFDYQAGYQFIHQKQGQVTLLRSNVLLYVTLRL
jgi:Protein of unknown function (DUF2490)